MRISLIIILGITCVLHSCKNSTEPPVNLLIGDWIRTNSAENQQTVEQWKETESGLNGRGTTYTDYQISFEEILSIQYKNNNYFYVVNGVNETPTEFKFTDWTDSSFTCENLENDFPKFIEYRFRPGKMDAYISDGENEIVFYFTKDTISALLLLKH